MNDPSRFLLSIESESKIKRSFYKHPSTFSWLTFLRTKYIFILLFHYGNCKKQNALVGCRDFLKKIETPYLSERGWFYWAKRGFILSRKGNMSLEGSKPIQVLSRGRNHFGQDDTFWKDFFASFVSDHLMLSLTFVHHEWFVGKTRRYLTSSVCKVFENPLKMSH